MYDLTTLHFAVSDEDRLRKVGMSKEHRVDPQVTVGLLVTATGLPLEVALFEGNKAETKTLVPVTEQLKTRHGITDLVPHQPPPPSPRTSPTSQDTKSGPRCGTRAGLSLASRIIATPRDC